MNFIEFGMLSGVLVCGAVSACGGSSVENGSSSAGTNSSMAGSGTSSAGTSSSGGNSSTGGTSFGVAGTSAGGACTVSTMLPDPTTTPCPELITCAESSCKTQVAACDAMGLEGCIVSSCFAQALACGEMGAAGASAGGGKTCADLGACCATVTNAQQQQACSELVLLGMDAYCGLAYANFCAQ